MRGKIDLEEVKLQYLQGRGSIRELAIKNGFAVQTVVQRCAKEGWKKERDIIENQRLDLANKVNRTLIEKTSSAATEQIKAHLDKVLSDQKGFLTLLGEKLREAQLPNIKDFQDAEQAVRAYARSDDLIRRAHGLPDTPQSVDITSGGLSMHQQSLAVLESCRKLVADGKAKASSLDIEALVQEAKEVSETGDSQGSGSKK